MSKQKVKFILVEDGTEDARLFDIIMKEIAPSIEISVFSNPMEFQKMMQARPNGPEHSCVIIVDINLPGMSGLALLSEIKAHPSWKRTPVIVLTTSGAETDIQTAYSEHASGFIQKPHDIDDFRRTIKAITDYWLGAVLLANGR